MEADSKFCVQRAQKVTIESFQVRMGRGANMELVLRSGEQHQVISLNLQEALDLVSQVTELASYRVRKLSRELLEGGVTN